MNLIIAVLSLLTALLPIADKGIQSYQHYLQRQRETARVAMVSRETPPEAGQPHVFFHEGAWWKYENGQWFIWRQTTQIAQGGSSNVAR